MASGLGATRRAAMLLLLMMLTMTATTAWAQSGSCGEGLTWELNDNTLTISGTGAMNDYNDGMKPTPWSSYASDIQTVVISDGVTSIGMRAFLNCSALATVTVYAPSCTLGEDAFLNCNNLANIYVFSNLVDGYKAAENWNAYAGNITALPTVTTSYVDATGILHENVEAIPLNNAMTTLPAGTYVVNSDVAYTGTVTLSGDVTLILADGCTMSFGKEGELLNGTIIECNSHNLTIYGQSGGTGWLKAYSAQYDGINAVYDSNSTAAMC